MSYFTDIVLRQAFKHFDKSGDDKISREELQHALTKLGLPAGSLQVKMMIKAVDKDHDGTVDFHEFKQLANSLASTMGESSGEH